MGLIWNFKFWSKNLSDHPEITMLVAIQKSNSTQLYGNLQMTFVSALLQISGNTLYISFHYYVPNPPTALISPLSAVDQRNRNSSLMSFQENKIEKYNFSRKH